MNSNPSNATMRTRSTLLVRIKDHADDQAWREFHNLYAPLLYRYARGRGLPQSDAEEVRDQCLEVVTRRIATFNYVRERGGFKNWLRRIADHKVIDLLRKRREFIGNSAEMRSLRERQPSLDDTWEQQWRSQHLRYCVEQVRPLVSETNFQAFCMLMFGECTVKEVASRLGLNANQVYHAKSRVLQRVRQKMAELGVDDQE